MKRFIVYCCFLMIGVVFFMGGCNTPDNNPTTGNGPGEDEAEEIEITDGHVYDDFTGNNFPGFEVDLAQFLSAGQSYADISQYESVAVDATLYSAYTDEDDNTVAVLPTGPDEEKNMAQFTLLTATGGWPTGDWSDPTKRGNACGPTQYNMVANGTTTWTVTPDSTGVPAKLLVQKNEQDFTANSIVAIKIKSIKFKPRTSDISLSVLFPKDTPSTIEASGNQITFKNVTYSDCAALFIFPSSWGGTATDSSALAGRTITFTYNIPDHTCVLPAGATAETVSHHQLHIQAAHNDSSANKYNGKDPGGNNGVGQHYADLDNNTSFQVSADKLIAAAQDSNNTADGSPFVLDAVRIVNNGTSWPDTNPTDFRCKSYKIIFSSITISPSP
jgi:hypothetical protein